MRTATARKCKLPRGFEFQENGNLDMAEGGGPLDVTIEYYVELRAHHIDLPIAVETSGDDCPDTCQVGDLSPEEKKALLREHYYADSEYITQDILRPEIVRELWKRYKAVEREYRCEAAQEKADEELEVYAEAVHFIQFSPRGFGNEFSLYAVKKGDEDRAEKWVTGLEDQNSWSKILSREQVRGILESSIYHAYLAQDNSVYQAHVHALGIDGWWDKVQV